mgnify:CR=1 FL=1
MSCVVQSVNVEGFWGSHSLTFDLHEDINFLIGVNGSGKTTLIKLISSALTGDFLTLDQIDFQSIEIRLKRKTPYAKPYLRVEKKFLKKYQYVEIILQVWPTASSQPLTFRQSDFLPMRYRRDLSFSKYRARLAKSALEPLETELTSLASISWLAVDRKSDSEDDRSSSPPVDAKLDSLQLSLASFFSTLQNSSEEEFKKFQHSILYSMLKPSTPENLFISMLDLEIEEEENSLLDVFRELGADAARGNRRINDHFKRVKESIKKLRSEEEIDFSNLTALLSGWNLHQVVSAWHTLAETKEEIFRPQTMFIALVNDFFQRKKLSVSKSNHLKVVTQSGKELSPRELSSGEKQLLILLGEALLQAGRTAVFIADEPELSLHVEWQEKLVRSVRSLNPAAQIIFATHSPDIVGPFQNRIVDMEAIVE